MLSYRLGTVNDFHWGFKPVFFISVDFEDTCLIVKYVLHDHCRYGKHLTRCERVLKRVMLAVNLLREKNAEEKHLLADVSSKWVNCDTAALWQLVHTMYDVISNCRSETKSQDCHDEMNGCLLVLFHLQFDTFSFDSNYWPGK